MGLFRRHRLLTNISLVMLVLTLARIAELSQDITRSAALIIVALMGLQTLAFAAPDHSRGIVSPRRLRQALSIRAIGFAAVCLLALASYVLQRIFMFHDWRVQLNLSWLLLPLLFSVLLDAICSRPYVDEYWTIGRTLTTRRRIRTIIAGRDFGSCFIKVFFYPLMFIYTERYIGLFHQYWLPKSWSAAEIYESLAVYHLLVDLIFGACGYALSLQALGNRIRSVNPYFTGWMVTMICYSPLAEIVGRMLVFEWRRDWIVLTQEWPVVQAVWLMMIACCLVVYAWATVELGPRFSNLSYRGTVESGPYRLMKHPAYVSKVASFWLITVPFVPISGWNFAGQQCLVLGIWSLIYYLRAKYEEKHLMQYPEYRTYASR
jgi:isoprenylcysteine carboxyl methyltransferase (ICMT) family protein YpbQ